MWYARSVLREKQKAIPLEIEGECPEELNSLARLPVRPIPISPLGANWTFASQQKALPSPWQLV